MPRRIYFVLAALIAASVFMADDTMAQYGYLWQKEVDHPNNCLGGVHMDTDSVPELVFFGGWYGSDRIVIVDGATGIIEWDSGNWVQIYNAQLIDVDGDGLTDILLDGYEVTTPQEFFVVSYNGGSVAINEYTYDIKPKPTLDQNYPNPFNPSTTFNYEITARGHVQIDIFNARGEHVRRLEDKELDAGEYTAVWNGRNDAGAESASGTYFYQLRAGEYTSSKKALLLK